MITYNQLILIGNLLNQLGVIDANTTEPAVNTIVWLRKMVTIVDENTGNKNKEYVIEKIKEIDINKLRQEIQSKGISKTEFKKIVDSYYDESVKIGGFSLGFISRKWVNYFMTTSSPETKTVIQKGLEAETDQKRAEIMFDYLCNQANQKLGFCAQSCKFFKPLSEAARTDLENQTNSTSSIRRDL